MNSFTLWLGLGAGIGLWRVARSAPERQSRALVNTGLALLLAALIGARLFYVGMNWRYFSMHPLEVIQLWQGGLAWPGAVIGAGLLLFLIPAQYQLRSPHNRITTGWLSDRLFPMLLPLTVSAWMACWQSGCAYGPALAPGTWFGAPSLDETGQYALRWPLQPLAAISMILYLGLLESRTELHQPPGRLSMMAVAGLLLHLAGASLLRADPAPQWNNLRYDTWMALALLAYLVIFTLIKWAGRMSLTKSA